MVLALIFHDIQSYPHPEDQLDKIEFHMNGGKMKDKLVKHTYQAILHYILRESSTAHFHI